MTDDMRDDALSGALARSVESLREEMPVRPHWRAELLARVDADRKRARGWRMRPSVAIAAGIVLLFAGGAIGRYSRSPAAEAPALASVRFVFVAPGAARVSVVGDFNHWDANATPLRKLSDGTWIIDVPIDPGRYAYAFVVDGKIEVDPAAPRAQSEFGENSVLMVRGS
jgi:1,4-alpha-glucan branching enzyme